MSCLNLRDTFEREYAGLRRSSRPIILAPGERIEPVSNDLYAVICRAQDSFRAPHDRWAWCKPALPIPFRWGPQGSLILLVGMFVAYACVVAGLLAAF